MKDILLSVPEQHYPFIIKLVRSFDYVTVKETNEVQPPTKKEFMDGLREAIEEVKLIKAVDIVITASTALQNKCTLHSSKSYFVNHWHLANSMAITIGTIKAKTCGLK